MTESLENPKIRVLVVDDSSLMRKIISMALLRNGIDVAGFAVNGLEAIEAVNKLKPDVVTLDIEMPEMDGLSALREIRKTHRRLPIIMFSTLTQKGAQATVMALTRGASDYVEKPSNHVGGMEESFQVLNRELIPKVQALARRAKLPTLTKPSSFVAPASLAKPDAAANLRERPRSVKPIKFAHAVCIGVSTGGPVALMDLFAQFVAPLPVPIFIVQHIPASFSSMLAARLSVSGVMEVKEPQDGEEAKPGVAYLAPGGQHMVLGKTNGKVTIHLNMDPPENSCRPAVDVLFRSAVQIYGSDLLAVVMTGMGYDGLKGCQLVQQRKGQVIVQDEDSSVIWGMPGAVAGAGLADAVLPLDNLGSEIVNRIRKHKLP